MLNSTEFENSMNFGGKTILGESGGNEAEEVESLDRSRGGEGEVRCDKFRLLEFAFCR